MRSKLTKGLLIASLIMLGWFGINYYTVVTKSAVTDKVIVEIASGDSFGEITRKLLAQNIVIDPLWFKVLALQQGIINNLKPGEYELMPGLTAAQILTQFAEGKSIRYSVTFPEGWNLKEILQALAKTSNLEQTLAHLSVADVSKKLGINENNPEGWLFPDTYYFEKNAPDMSILTRAHKKCKAY